MPPWFVMKILLYVGTYSALLLLVECQQFDVLKITNVRFPSSNKHFAAHAKIAYKDNVSEYTICYRHLVESYNDGYYTPVHLTKDTFSHRIFPPGLGGINGFTGSIVCVRRNIPGGGLGNRRFPGCMWPFFPKDIDISKWYHMCLSYSSTLQHVHMYMDSFYVFSYTYEDPREDPLPSDAFEEIFFGRNMRGLIADVQIYNKYMDEKTLAAQTKGCNNKPGEIFSWDTKHINITQVMNI